MRTSQARLDAAQALRELGNAMIARQVSDELFEAIAGTARSWSRSIETLPERQHAFFLLSAGPFDRSTPEGPSAVRGEAFPDSMVSGDAHPLGMEARVWREGDEAVLQATLGKAFEGAPGRAHGGAVAALIDEAMGMVLSIVRTPAFTGRLSISYRAPTPLFEVLEVRARLVERVERKLLMEAQLRSGPRLIAEAEGLFVTVATGHFLAEGNGGNGAARSDVPPHVV